MALRSLDLMIGDWVRIDEPDKYAGATGQIQSLMYHREGDAAYFHVFIQGEFGYVSRDVCSDDIRPIPLTPEILEKNGFVVESRGNPRHNLQYCILTDGLWIDISGENFFEGKLEYVHQLQQALRICGIEKEIEL